MTSINAIRFDHDRGIMAVDEIRSWNPEDMKLNSADKVRRVIPEEVTAALGIVGSYANTGTSSIGDELRLGIRAEIKRRFHAWREEHGAVPSWNGDDIARIIWDVMVEMKTRHTDQYLDGRYGICQEDVIRGYSLDDEGRRVELKDETILEKAFEAVTWAKKSDAVRPVYGNAGIYAGIDPILGFRIYQFNLMEQYAEPVDGCFFANGSASDTTSRVLAEFSGSLSPEERRGGLEPAMATLVLIAAINDAGRTNIGVGGYCNLHLFDRGAAAGEYLREINDHRAKLAAEVADAWRQGYLAQPAAVKMIDGLLFQNDPLQVHFNRFQKLLDENPGLERFLRGYRDLPR